MGMKESRSCHHKIICESLLSTRFIFPISKDLHQAGPMVDKHNGARCGGPAGERHRVRVGRGALVRLRRGALVRLRRPVGRIREQITATSPAAMLDCNRPAQVIRPGLSLQSIPGATLVQQCEFSLLDCVGNTPFPPAELYKEGFCFCPDLCEMRPGSLQED